MVRAVTLRIYGGWQFWFNSPPGAFLLKKKKLVLVLFFHLMESNPGRGSFRLIISPRGSFKHILCKFFWQPRRMP